MFESFDNLSLEDLGNGISEKFQDLKAGFESSVESVGGFFSDIGSDIEQNFSSWLGIDVNENVTGTAVKESALNEIKTMYEGPVFEDGSHGLGLKEISDWKINEKYENQNYKQHAGYSAEVISTAKENVQAKVENQSVKTYRYDDVADHKNDQYIDKIRVPEGVDPNDLEHVEKIQVKFVGNDGKECLEKLASKKFDKYFNDGKVDKVEIPKDFYDDIKKLIPEKKADLERQMDHAKQSGNSELEKQLSARIERYDKIDSMIEKSTVSSDEAIEATKHPERYVSKLCAKDLFMESHHAGMESAALAATITGAVSTVDNVQKVIAGEMTAEDAFVDVAKDAGVAGAISYGTTFISTAVSNSMASSSHTLIRSMGKLGVPAAVVSLGVQSFDSVVDYANGTIDGSELAKDIGGNAASIAGSMAGSALAGAAGSAIAGATIGSVVPGVGTAVGFAAGMVGGMVGCAVASEAYESVVEFGEEHGQELLDKAKDMANQTVDWVKDTVPAKVDEIKLAINDFASSNNLPFQV